MKIIKFHKILFGDPHQFMLKDGKLDETKRIKSSLSPRRTTFDSPEFNSFLNDEYNLVDDIALTPEDPGYHEHKSYINTVTLTDVKLLTDLYDAKPFEETDGASIVMDNTYREIKLKNGQWSTEAEIWHQWQMAYTRQNLPGYKYTNEDLRKHDITLVKTREPNFVTEVLKPIVTGTRNGNKIHLVLDKFSQMPLYYKFAQDRNLGKFYIKMLKENVDYAVFESARKVGAENSHALYNPNGTFNDSLFIEDQMIQIPWKIYGIQVENSYEHQKEQTRGSQITKVASLDMFDNGVAISETAEKEYKKNIEILDKIHENAYNMLLKKFGIETLGTTFALTDPKVFSETLAYELFRRDLSNNAKDTILLDENNQFIMPFEASPAYKQVKDIIYSIVNKSLSSLKTNGGPKVQVSVTLWENVKEGRGLVIKTDKGYNKITREEYEALSTEDKSKVRLTSDTLKFYSKEDPYCEVLLPNWMRRIFDEKTFPTDESILKYLETPEGKSILTGVGFRIPTQAMSSIEVFRVKGFLPASMGDTVVVPSEITAKAGSDFDIDKLNIYLKSVYKDDKGRIRLIKYQGSEEATKQFFSDIYTKTINNEISNVTEFNEFRDILNRIFTKLETIPEKTGKGKTSDYKLTEEENDFYDHHESLINDIIEQADDKDLLPSEYIEQQIIALGEKEFKLVIKLLDAKLREDYVNLMYKKSLENEYYASLERMITLPENFNRLVSPIDDAGLSTEAAELDELMNIDDTSIKNRILNRKYMTTLRHQFITAKRWIGIAAVNITGQSLTQKAKVYINTKRFGILSQLDRKILGDGSIILPHNTVTIDGEEFTSISGTKTADNSQYISDRLSGYATAFVDVAKDPYIMKLITSQLAVGTFMFLERIGAGKKIGLFMNQPIVRAYLQYLDNINYKYLYKKNNINFVLDKFKATQTQINNAQIDVNNLGNNISKYAEKGKFESGEDNAVQQAILMEFLKYSRMAEFSFELTQATNYDTTKFKNSDSFSKKKTKTEIARLENIFSSVDDLLNTNFIGKQKELLDSTMSAIGALLKLEEDRFRNITSSVMETFEKKKFMSGDDFDTIASKVKASFFDYIIQIKSGINSRIAELSISGNSVAVQLEAAKIKYPDVKILKDLEVRSSPRVDGAKTIKLKVNLKEAYDENLYTEMMRELKNIDPTLYDNIINLVILQGTYPSPVSIKNIIPIEDYAAKIKPIIDKLTASLDIVAFSKGWFQRNNWKDEVIMYTYKPKFKASVASEYDEHFPIGEDPYGNEIFQYFAPAFPTTPFGNATDRKIITINPTYDPMTVENDFIKINRIQTINNEQIDFTTGRTITSIMFAKRKENGDLSLKDVFGYQKVKYSNGQPLLTNKGEYVYKLINLYGDGNLASEYYESFKPSVLDNGTMKITMEIEDGDIIEHYAPTSREDAQGIEDVEYVDVTDEEVEISEIVEVPKINQSSSTTINIYAGTNENAELSNFAERPVRIGGMNYKNVESAFQHTKLIFSNPLTTQPIAIQEAQWFNLTGKKAKALGKLFKGLDTVEWDNQSSSIMKTILKESFIQNPNALQKLLTTGNATLTHTQDRSKWGTEFPKLLMEVREELRSPENSEVIDELVPETKLLPENTELNTNDFKCP